MDSKVKVLDINTEQVLFECSFEEIEKAFAYAAEMEQMGVEVRVVSPTITESLCDSLGIDYDKRADYEQSVAEEMEDHDGSCCAQPYQAPSTDKLQ